MLPLGAVLNMKASDIQSPLQDMQSLAALPSIELPVHSFFCMCCPVTALPGSTCLDVVTLFTVKNAKYEHKEILAIMDNGQFFNIKTIKALKRPK